MSILKLARPEIAALSPYEAAAQVDDTIRLNANESPQENAIGGFRRPLNRYPEIRPRRLRDALATRFGCTPEQLLVTRGSSEAIDLLIRTFCRAGVDSIVTPSPSFSMYRHYAAVQNARVIEVPTSAANDYAIDTGEVLTACDKNTRLVFVCSPNNPTGTPLARADLLQLIEQLSEKSVVVVDEAYLEFGREASAVELLQEQPNLVILRTLSKALGFAGARCGAVIGDAALVRILNAVQAPYALATPVVECVEDALGADQLERAANAVREIIRERERVMTAISKFRFVEKVWPSQANFFLIRVHDADTVMRRCAEHKVLLRNFGDDLEGCIRITVGSRNDNERMLAAFESLAEE